LELDPEMGRKKLQIGVVLLLLGERNAVGEERVGVGVMAKGKL
jgi:hypothetical protein